MTGLRAHRMGAALAAVAALGLLAASPAAGQDAPKRLMPFLGRGAVVRESGEPTPLIGSQARPLPTLVIGRDAPGPRQAFGNKEIARAATTLSAHVEKITGVKLPAVTTAVAGEKAAGPRLFVGVEGEASALFPELKTADAHGFVIAARPGPRGADLYLVGACGTSTHYAVWFFLMNYAGWRTVLPGEVGEVYDRRDPLSIPKDLYVFNPGPDFLMRIWSGAAGMDQEAWLADSGGTQRFEYHHNMKRIYEPARFGKTNPEFYPVRQGKPYIPGDKEDSAWQPTFSNPAAAQRAVEYAAEHFAARPDMLSVSLSVNDGLGYSEADIRLGGTLPDGRANVSDVYYKYVNDVARAVKQRWPDRYVAFFPYNLVKTPPGFALEDNVMIFLLNEPKTVYEEWKGKVQRVGVYQWLYGMGWVIPNHWPHALQDYLRWVRARGGVAFKGEAYPAWVQDGPKMWVLNNLLWNVDADVDALLKDYYEHSYGKEAAPAMSRFFGQTEKIYERRRTETEYRLTYWHPGERQFEHVTEEDIAAMSAAIQEAERSVQGEANRRRVDLAARCFRWGRLYWDRFAALKRLKAAKVESEADAQAILQAAQDFHRLPAECEAHYKSAIEPMAQLCVYSAQKDKVEWQSADPSFTWADLDASFGQGFGAVSAFRRRTQTPQAVAEFWAETARHLPDLTPFAEAQRLALLHPDRPLRNLLTNGSFEEPPGPPDPKDKNQRAWVARDWAVYHNRMVNATVALDREVKRSGQVSATARGITDYSGLIRWAAVKNRRQYRLSYWYRTTPQTPHVARTIMIQPPIREHDPPVETWTRAERVFTVAYPKADAVTISILLCLRHGGSDQSQAWFDDARLEMLSPDGVEAVP